MEKDCQMDNTPTSSDHKNSATAKQSLLGKKGRGAISNEGSRYNTHTSFRDSDGWETPQVEEGLVAELTAPVATEIFADQTKKIITTNRSPDINFSQSINPYKGCEHGCIYCFARPTHAYLDLSPGLDFETKIFYKAGAKERLMAELAKPKYQCSTIAMGTNTDPYQPIEKKLKITRQILEVMVQTKHPVSIVTKSTLILRDIDLLQQLAQLGLVSVNISVTCLENSLKTILEPRTANPGARVRAIKSLNEAGVPTGAMLAPIIPFINDHEIENMVETCANAGAVNLAYILLRLPLEVAPMFEQWLHLHYPLKAKRVMSAVYATRGGKAYDAKWHKRMIGQGPIAQLLQKRFHNAKQKYLTEQRTTITPRCDLFEPPNESSQMNLF